jgi:hypothetical protein
MGEGTQNQTKLVRDFKRNMTKTRRVPIQIHAESPRNLFSNKSNKPPHARARARRPRRLHPVPHRTTARFTPPSLPLRFYRRPVGRSSLLLRPPRHPPSSSFNSKPPHPRAGRRRRHRGSREAYSRRGPRASSRRGRRGPRCAPGSCASAAPTAGFRFDRLITDSTGLCLCHPSSVVVDSQRWIGVVGWLILGCAGFSLALLHKAEISVPVCLFPPSLRIK